MERTRLVTRVKIFFWRTATRNTQLETSQHEGIQGINDDDEIKEGTPPNIIVHRLQVVYGPT
jgi:hypothetical protein